MDGDKKRVGRPRADDPMIKIDNVRCKVSTINNLEQIATKLDIKYSVFIRNALEKIEAEYHHLLDK